MSIHVDIALVTLAVNVDDLLLFSGLQNRLNVTQVHLLTAC